MRRLLLLVTTVALSLTACGEAPRETADGAATTPTATTATRALKPLTAKQAEAALLTVEDLPAGWTLNEESDVAPAAGEVEPARCALFLDGFWKPVGPAVAEASVGFTSGEMTTSVGQSVAAYEKDAAGLVAQVADAAGACRKIATPDGGKLTTSVPPFPDLGDGSAAVRVKTTLGALDLTFDLAFVAQGPNMIVIYAGGTKPLPSEDLEAFTRTALSKLG